MSGEVSEESGGNDGEGATSGAMEIAVRAGSNECERRRAIRSAMNSESVEALVSVAGEPHKIALPRRYKLEPPTAGGIKTRLVCELTKRGGTLQSDNVYRLTALDYMSRWGGRSVEGNHIAAGSYARMNSGSGNSENCKRGKEASNKRSFHSNPLTQSIRHSVK